MICDSISPSVDEVLKDQVFLGNLSASECAETKKDLGITHIISVCPEAASTGKNHLVIAVDDSEYADLLIHLPNACRFIEDALEDGGRILIHCVMGISRSPTVLMKTRSLTTDAAISFIKGYRPRVQPNYGFVKQLDTFLECGCAPSVTHPAYISWKRRQKQDVTNFLNQLIDCAVIIPDTLLLCSEFPNDPDQAKLLLINLDVTHLLSLTPAEISSAPVQHRRIEISPDAPDALLLALPDACEFIRDAIATGGTVLVHSLLEVRTCTVAGAYLMTSRNISPKAAADIIQDALPLFDPTLNFTRALALFAACKHKPTSTHPAIFAHQDSESVGWRTSHQHLLPHSPHSVLKAPTTALCNVDAMTRTAASVMSETGIDMRAFGDALAAIQRKATLAESATA
ncbi:protein-tyrosine phosphatase-like protein [Mycena alexandri]|uniref:protein-tyrosine-phosphatase n=1 Tax=Mycena alexandri TaxID=1745969 RepID=A0AAD6TDK6_9AGAR|nr:protein-tyrosine phosphatase-like protein [Mycena alexandri]